MCLALYASVGKEISRQQFDRFSLSNSDGYGMLWVEDNILKYYKTLALDDFYSNYKQWFDKVKDTPFVLHFRLGTGGKKDLENCHPFMCNDQIGFVHNGIISGMANEQNYSDTYVFNRDYLVPISDEIYGEFTRMLIEDNIGSNNKLIFLNNKKEHLIINEDQGKWNDGVWYSSAWHAYEPTENKTCGPSIHSNNTKRIITKKNTRINTCHCALCGEVADNLLFEIVDDYKMKKGICIFCLRAIKNYSIGELIEILADKDRIFGRSI